MKYNEYLAQTTHSSNEVLEDWRWLIGPRLQLWHVTKAGDALLQDPEDGSVHFLDVISGEVSRIARDRSEFELLVARAENADEWLIPEMVDGQAELGMRPGENKCLSFRHPPVLGGEIEPENIEISDIAVHFSMAGQIHKQVKDLPPGTKISGVQIQKADDGAQKKPWWRFW